MMKHLTLKSPLSHEKTISHRKIILLLTILTILSACIVLFVGLTPKNIDFFLPRRLKKVGAILITSYCIGYTSVTFQTITNNRILTPSVMGLDSLYMLIQTIIVFFFGSRQLTMMTEIDNFLLSIGVMILASVLLFLFLFKKDGKSVYFLVLAGMILGGLFGGLSTFMQVLLDPNEFLILQGKMFASFNNINSDLLTISIIILLIVIIITWKDFNKLDAIALGPDLAINLGVSYKQMVFKNLMVTAVLVSVSTALTGPITFLGILVASLSRELIKTYHHTWRVLGAFLMGGFSLILGQFLVEELFEFNTTISVIVNFVSGIYFIYLMLKEAKR